MVSGIYLDYASDLILKLKQIQQSEANLHIKRSNMQQLTILIIISLNIYR